MASLSNERNGTRRIQWFDVNGDRKTLRLGKTTKKAAESFKLQLERLIAAQRTGTPLDTQTAQWLSELQEPINAKLVAFGLADSRAAKETHTLGSMLDEYFAALSVKESTVTRYAQAQRLLIEHFGTDRAVDSITPREAERWRTAMQDRGFSTAKISRDVGIARMFFHKAVRWGMVAQNPFAEVKAGAQTNRERLYYLSPADASKLIETAPDAEWRCIIALSRYGGLRCPSEVLGVRWDDVHWEQNRIRVRSPKTEHHAGKGERLVPLFPELHAVLLDAFERAPEGSRFVVDRYQSKTANLRKGMLQIIEQAGLTPWPRLYNSLRASRATELAGAWPASVCTAWLGHNQTISEAHYQMVLDDDYSRAASTPIGATPPAPGAIQSGAECGAMAVQKTAQHRAAPSCTNLKHRPQTQAGSAFMPTPADPCGSMRRDQIGEEGLEPTGVGAQKCRFWNWAAQNTAHSTPNRGTDPRLGQFIRDWLRLPAEGVN